MTQELRIHPDARREFDDAVDYYEHESPGLGVLFTNEVDAGFARIREHPDSAPTLAQDVRKLALTKFPYNLVYETREGSLRILAVAHQHRRPYYWRSRG